MNGTQSTHAAASSTVEPKREPTAASEPLLEEMRAPVVLRPTPTLPSGSQRQPSAFQPPLARPPFSRSPVEPLSFPTSLGLPHPARSRPSSAQGLGGPNDSSRLPRATAEDELAASTVGSLSGRREDVAGPSAARGHPLARQASRDINDGDDSMSRLGVQAQQAMMQQQMLQAYQWQLMMTMQSGTAPVMPMAMPFMPPMPFMHPEMAAAYGYAPIDWRRRPRDWDVGSRRRRRTDNKVCSNCQTTCTPFWRKDRHDGSPLCNACGLYYAKNESHRPQALWKQEGDDDFQAMPPSMAPDMPPGLPPSAAPGMPPSAAPGMPPSVAPVMPASVLPSVVPGMMPSVPPSVVPGMMPSVPPSMLPSVPPNMPPSGPSSMPPSGPSSMPPSVPLSVPPSMSLSMPPVTPSMPPSVPPPP